MEIIDKLNRKKVERTGCSHKTGTGKKEKP